jgi:hypothetical protein
LGGAAGRIADGGQRGLAGFVGDVDALGAANDQDVYFTTDDRLIGDGDVPIPGVA